MTNNKITYKKICKCGHYYFWHKLSVFRYYYTLFGMLADIHGKCDLCNCNKFSEGKQYGK